MKKILATAMTTALVVGGLGLASGPAEARPDIKTAAFAQAGPLPLDLCDLLPLCTGPGGSLLTNVQDALDALLGNTGSPQDLATAIVAALQGLPSGDRPEAAAAIAQQLQSAGLSPAALSQVLSGLAGDSNPLGDLVPDLLATVQSLVNGLLGIGGQTPDPAQAQALTDQLLKALAAGDASALQAQLSSLLTSLPGGSGLSPATLTGLVNQIVAALQAGLGGPSTTPVVNNVDNAISTSAPQLASPGTYVTSKRPAIQGTGAPGASVTVRTSKGVVLGSATVSSTGTFRVTSRSLKRGSYTITATQTAPGRATSPQSAARTFRVVSAKPAITTTSNKKFKTHRPKITGIAYPKTKVVLRSSTGKKLGSAKVRANGTWTIKAKSLSSGTRKIKVTQTGYGKKKTSKVKKIRIR